jgi:hypothetical protein
MVNFYKIADSVIEKSRHDGIPTYLTPTNYELMVAAVRAGYDAAAIEQFDPPLTEAEADAYWDAISDEPESADPVASTPPCECSCHTMPGVMHVAACCQAGLTAQQNRTQEEK